MEKTGERLKDHHKHMDIREAHKTNIKALTGRETERRWTHAE